jgi:hypothetical protein
LAVYRTKLRVKKTQVEDDGEEEEGDGESARE